MEKPNCGVLCEAEAEIRKGTNKIRAKKLPGDRAQVLTPNLVVWATPN